MVITTVLGIVLCRLSSSCKIEAPDLNANQVLEALEGPLMEEVHLSHECGSKQRKVGATHRLEGPNSVRGIYGSYMYPSGDLA